MPEVDLMPSYSINPYISFVESRLFPEFVQHAVFHRLTGEIFEPSETVRELLLAIKSDSQISLNGDEFNILTDDDAQLKHLIQNHFLIADGFDFLAPLLDHYCGPSDSKSGSGLSFGRWRVDSGANFDGAHCLLAKTRRTTTGHRGKIIAVDS